MAFLRELAAFPTFHLREIRAEKDLCIWIPERYGRTLSKAENYNLVSQISKYSGAAGEERGLRKGVRCRLRPKNKAFLLEGSMGMFLEPALCLPQERT